MSETKSTKRPFHSERIISTGTVVSEPKDYSSNSDYMLVRFRISCKYVPSNYDPELEENDRNYYKFFRTVQIIGNSSYSLPNNVLKELKVGDLVTIIGRIEGSHYVTRNGENIHDTVILAEEVTTNWRFNAWTNVENDTSKSRGRRTSARTDDDDTEPHQPRRRRRATSGDEADETEKETEPAARRRRAITKSEDDDEEQKEDNPARRSRRATSEDTPKPKIESRGDFDDSDEFGDDQ